MNDGKYGAKYLIHHSDTKTNTNTEENTDTNTFMVMKGCAESALRMLKQGCTIGELDDDDGSYEDMCI